MYYVITIRTGLGWSATLSNMLPDDTVVIAAPYPASPTSPRYLVEIFALQASSFHQEAPPSVPKYNGFPRPVMSK